MGHRESDSMQTLLVSIFSKHKILNMKIFTTNSNNFRLTELISEMAMVETVINGKSIN